MPAASSNSTAPTVPTQKILVGQKALVTGANSGIGRGVAIALGHAGADVVVNYVEGDDAANAVVDSVRSILEPTLAGDWHSVCVCSDGSYGIEKGLICSFPVRSDGKGRQIVQGVQVNEFGRGKIEASVNELKEEKSMVADLLPK